MTFSDLCRLVAEDYRRHGSRWHERGVWALAVYRFGNWADSRSNPLVRSLFSKVYAALDTLSQITTGVTMNRDVRIGEGLHLIHTGIIIIHPDVVIGDRVGIAQNVTIGTNMGPEVPIIGDDAFIGAGACIIGKVRIGKGARVGANSLVINDVPDGCVAVGVPAKVLRSSRPSQKPSAAGAASDSRQVQRDASASSESTA